MRTRVKVSGLQSEGEVRAAVAAGADALGFDGEPPSGAVEPVAACPPGVSPMLHSSRADAHAIADQAREAGVAVVLLLPPLDPVVHAALRRVAPGLKLVQAVDADDDRASELARGYAPLVDALLLKTSRPALTVAELGGDARAVDWRRSRQIVHASPVPVWLAGGLSPAGVGEAIEQVNPFGVDVGVGVRTAGRLDARKLSSFFHAVRTAKTG